MDVIYNIIADKTVLHCEDMAQYFVTRNSLIEEGFQECSSTVQISRASNYIKLDQLGSVKMFVLCSKAEFEKYSNEDENE